MTTAVRPSLFRKTTSMTSSHRGRLERGGRERSSRQSVNCKASLGVCGTLLPVHLLSLSSPEATLPNPSLPSPTKEMKRRFRHRRAARTASALQIRVKTPRAARKPISSRSNLLRKTSVSDGREDSFRQPGDLAPSETHGFASRPHDRFAFVEELGWSSADIGRALKEIRRKQALVK